MWAADLSATARAVDDASASTDARAEDPLRHESVGAECVVYHKQGTKQEFTEAGLHTSITLSEKLENRLQNFPTP